MIEKLVDGPRSPQEMAGELGLTQQNVSKHLQVLHAVGLVSRRRDGSRVMYALVDDGLVDLLDRLLHRISLHLLELSRAAGGHAPDREAGNAEPASWPSIAEARR